ncbi:MAG: AAA family ATPase [Myxococcota bacterium]|nr:AAA family ATPase [Myxococcota bacterium]
MGNETPNLIVVTGYPASGKSSLANRLAKRLQLPCFSKDAIKERLFDSLTRPDECREDENTRDLSRTLSRTSIELLLDVVPPLLRAGRSLIIEANFDRDRDSSALREAAQIRSRIVQIVCQCPEELLRRRFLERIERGNRHACHDDRAYRQEFEERIRVGQCSALDIRGEVIDVDTSRFTEALVKQLADDVRTTMRGGAFQN